ncbi:MAG: hypothetical protein KBS61_06095 [Chryseobacterium sp.]|nr:hypothetical protein [Candidatus Chryseobacterium enterohippi]
MTSLKVFIALKIKASLWRSCLRNKFHSACKSVSVKWFSAKEFLIGATISVSSFLSSLLINELMLNPVELFGLDKGFAAVLIAESSDFTSTD